MCFGGCGSGCGSVGVYASCVSGSDLMVVYASGSDSLGVDVNGCGPTGVYVRRCGWMDV